MRKISTLLLALALLGASAWLGTAYATEKASGTHVLMPRNRIVDDDLMAAGNDVRVESRVNGDVAAAGSDVAVK